MRTPSYLLVSAFTLAGLASAQMQRVTVTLENLAPNLGTFQTPVWVGFHDGQFDTYDGGLPVNGQNALVPNGAVERLAEDGSTGPLGVEFLNGGTGVVEGTIPGPAGPIAPGDLAIGSFLMDPLAPTSRFFTYATMVIPSNDAFLSNGSPIAHPVFDSAGNFVFSPFFDTDVIDAGTEVNDELPINTAFFGQMAPDTGVVEGGVATTHLGFNPAGSGGILDSFAFSGADFTVPGYPLVRIQLRAAPAILQDRDYGTLARGSEEVPAVNSPGIGRFVFRLRNMGTELEMLGQLRNLSNVVAAHLHMAPAGQNGPVVANLLDPLAPGSGVFGPGLLNRQLESRDLVGPLAGMPIDALIEAMEQGNIYVNVHTNDGLPGANTGAGDFESGEVRGQLSRL